MIDAVVSGAVVFALVIMAIWLKDIARRRRRERIATAALQGALSNSCMIAAAKELSETDGGTIVGRLSNICVVHADSMIAELDKDPGD